MWYTIPQVPVPSLDVDFFIALLAAYAAFRFDPLAIAIKYFDADFQLFRIFKNIHECDYFCDNLLLCKAK